MNLFRGLPGHPFHPPLTGATIGAYTFATAMAVLSKLGVSEHNTATAWWLAVVTGLVLTVPTAITGFADWLYIESGTPLWRTATIPSERDARCHGRVRDHRRSRARRLRRRHGRRWIARPDARGYVLLATGGWLGGAIVFTHGMRVLKLVDEPTSRAISPLPKPEKEEAEA